MEQAVDLSDNNIQSCVLSINSIASVTACMQIMVVQCQHYTTSVFSRLESKYVRWADICS